MSKGIKNRGSQVHHVKRDDLLAKEADKEIAESEHDMREITIGATRREHLSQKQLSQLRSYKN